MNVKYGFVETLDKFCDRTTPKKKNDDSINTNIRNDRMITERKKWNVSWDIMS